MLVPSHSAAGAPPCTAPGAAFLLAAVLAVSAAVLMVLCIAFN